jgi:hypothetical protein
LPGRELLRICFDQPDEPAGRILDMLTPLALRNARKRHARADRSGRIRDDRARLEPTRRVRPSRPSGHRPYTPTGLRRALAGISPGLVEPRPLPENGPSHSFGFGLANGGLSIWERPPLVPSGTVELGGYFLTS